MNLEQLKTLWDGFLRFLLPESAELRQFKSMNAGELRSTAPALAKDLEGIPGTTAVFNYRNPLVKAGILALKFRGDRKAAALLADALFEVLSAEEEDSAPFEGRKKPIIAIIPLSKRRLRERGFNQCGLLIDCLPPESQSFFETRKGLLHKVRETAPQMKLNLAERLKNIRGAFEVAEPKKVRGRRVIVIDDVTTTGATFAEARRALLTVGAKEVVCVALAH